MSYEQRDAAQAEMYVLQSNAEEQQLMFEKEWNELGELIHKDKLMKQMLQAKEQERSQQLLRTGQLGRHLPHPACTPRCRPRCRRRAHWSARARRRRVD